ncbi:MAG TPA: DNA polymerase III subunit chi [Steroidobacteraceae bacterium]|jgi:DNA polymerase-3 subunit chi|nr:DNA polymerase III subunit chi [Steroidobacteraceae bacterium]
MPRVSFYLSGGTEERLRLKIACRLAEQAYLSGQKILVSMQDPSQLQRFDDLLWTFADRSFVPHEPYREDAQWQDTPVLLGCDTQPQRSFDLLINLTDAMPPAVPLANQVAEIIDGDDARRKAGRARFRQYRDQGMTLETHDIAAEQAP